MISDTVAIEFMKLIATMFSPLIGAYVTLLLYKMKKDMAIQNEDTREALYIADKKRAKKLEEIHGLVNGQMTQKLKELADLLRWKANQTGLQEDIIAADQAEKSYFNSLIRTNYDNNQQDNKPSPPTN